MLKKVVAIVVSIAAGIVVVLNTVTKEVAAELEFSRDLPEYRAAIDAALAAAKSESQ